MRITVHDRKVLDRFNTEVQEAIKNNNNENQALASALNKMGILDQAARLRLIGLYMKDKKNKNKAKEALAKWWENFKIVNAEELAEIGARDAELQ